MGEVLQKIILVGATSGIGKELAMLYAARGFRVAIAGRRENLLNEIKNLYPQNIITACFDVTANNLNDQLTQSSINRIRQYF